jgi:hypothetical protein
LIKVDPKPLEEPAMAQRFNGFNVTTWGRDSVMKIAQRNHPVMASRQASDSGSKGGAMVKFDGLLSADEAWHLRHEIHVAAFFGGGGFLRHR